MKQPDAGFRQCWFTAWRRVAGIATGAVLFLLLAACQEQGSVAESGAQSSEDTAPELVLEVAPLLGELGSSAATGAILDPPADHDFPGNLRVRLEASHPETIEQLYLAVGEPGADRAFSLCRNTCGVSDLSGWVSGLDPSALAGVEPGPLTLRLLVDDGDVIAEVDSLDVTWSPAIIELTSAQIGLNGLLLLDWSASGDYDYFNVRALSGEFETLQDLPSPEGQWRQLAISGTSTALQLPESAVTTPVTAWVERVDGSGTGVPSSPVTVAYSNPDADFSSPQAFRAPRACWIPPSQVVAGSTTEWSLQVNDPESQVALTHDGPAALGLSLDAQAQTATFDQPQSGSYSFSISADNQRGTVETLGPFQIQVLSEAEGLSAGEFEVIASQYEPMGGNATCQALQLAAWNNPESLTPVGLADTSDGVLMALDSGEDWRVHRALEGRRFDPGPDRFGYYYATGNSMDGTSLQHMIHDADEDRLFLMAVGMDSGSQIFVRVLDAADGDFLGQYQLESLTAFPGIDFQRFTGAGTLSPDGNVLYLGGLDDGFQPVVMAVDVSGSGPAVAGDFGGANRSYSDDFPEALALHFGADGELYLFSGGMASPSVHRVPVEGPGAGFADPDYGAEGAWILEDFSDLDLQAVARSEMGDIVALLSGFEGSSPVVVVRLDPVTQSVEGVIAEWPDRFPAGFEQSLQSLAHDSQDRLYVLTNDESFRPEVHRFTADGQPDLTWGDAGVATLVGDVVEAEAERLVVHDDRLHVLISSLEGPSLIRLTEQGLPDGSDNLPAQLAMAASLGDRAVDMAVMSNDFFPALSHIMSRVPGPGFDPFADSTAVWGLEPGGDIKGDFGGGGELLPEFLGNSDVRPAGLALFYPSAETSDLLIAGTTVAQPEDWAVALHDGESGQMQDSLDNVLELLLDGGSATAHSATGRLNRAYVTGWRTGTGGTDEAVIANYDGLLGADPDGLVLGGSFANAPARSDSRALDGTIIYLPGEPGQEHLATLVYHFDRSGSDQINPVTQLVVVEETSSVGFEVIPDGLGGTVPLALTQHLTSEGLLLVVASLKTAGEVLLSAYEIEGPGLEIQSTPKWQIEAAGLQPDNQGVIALSEARTGEPTLDQLFVGGSDANGQPLLLALDPVTGIEERRWSDRDLGQVAYGHVVAVQPVIPEYTLPDETPYAVMHLQALIHSYVEGRWSNRVVRLPFLSMP